MEKYRRFSPKSVRLEVGELDNLAGVRAATTATIGACRCHSNHADEPGRIKSKQLPVVGVRRYAEEPRTKSRPCVSAPAASVGLASKLPDFQSLAVTMTLFESSLAGLTKTVSAAPIVSKKDAAIKVPAPEWQGN